MHAMVFLLVSRVISVNYNNKNQIISYKFNELNCKFILSYIRWPIFGFRWAWCIPWLGNIQSNQFRYRRIWWPQRFRHYGNGFGARMGNAIQRYAKSYEITNHMKLIMSNQLIAEKYEYVGRLLRPGEEPNSYSDEEDDSPNESNNSNKTDTTNVIESKANSSEKPKDDWPNYSARLWKQQQQQEMNYHHSINCPKHQLSSEIKTLQR